ncbi:MAG: cardiolipin synthase B [Deltaproteobacteria bacterium]|nr:cardiolipin synthase B [Deltaproteobacteria bacterium]
MMDRITGTTATFGNRVQLLTNGEQAFPQMLAAIDNAKERVSLEIYKIRMDAVGRRFVEALTNAAERGVRVRFLYDAYGSRTVNGGDFAALRAAGAEVRVFNPVMWWTLLRVNNRDHRKILVVDGRIAFVGGVNLAKEYDGNGVNGWRDTVLMVEGPAALDAERVFASSWLQGGRGFMGKDLPMVGFRHFKRVIDDPLMWLLGLNGTFCLPEHAPMADGAAHVRVISSAPDHLSSTIVDKYLLAINSAQKHISISCAYFVPPLILRRALVDAAKRGVQVRLILQGSSDSPLARTISIGYYGRLLKHGVEIYEWTRSVLHAKTMVVDGVWATVGSANLDGRALFLSYEANVAVIDPGLAAAMEQQFEDDLKHCRRVMLKEWKKRPFTQRVWEILFTPFVGQF